MSLGGLSDFDLIQDIAGLNEEPLFHCLRGFVMLVAASYFLPISIPWV